ncbi:unnamed protein product [Peniophora sp. CBMAI 1063]|nr:unnamed protein product [Peniophora sp. CBMAI 1063]
MANPNSPSPYLAIVRSRFSSLAPPGVQQAHHLQNMDTEIRSIQLALEEARRIRNMNVGAYRLPPEVLTQVFEDVQEQWGPEREVEEKKDSNHEKVQNEKGSEPWRDVFTGGWMVVTHVCAYWRKVALGNPSLWSESEIDVVSIHPGYIPDIIARCRGRPIHLHLNTQDLEFRASNESEVEEDAGVQAWISPLVLGLTKDLAISALYEMLEYTASRLPTEITHLRKLYLETNGLTMEAPEEVAPKRFWELNTVSDLTLSSCAIPWRSPIFSSSLTRLVLQSMDGVQYPKTYVELRDLLSRMPHLQVLEMWNIVPDPLAQQDLTIDLPPSLRRVEINVIRPERVLDGLWLMERVRSPPSCSVDFSIWPGWLVTENPAINDLLHGSMHHMLSNSNVTAPRHLVLSHNTFIIASTDIFADRGPNVMVSATSAPDTTVSAFSITESERRFGNEGMIVYDMTPLLGCINLENLRAVAFSSETIHAISTQNIWTMFLAAVDVRRIDLESPHAAVSAHFSDLQRALCHRYSVGSTDGPHWKLLLPRLQTLALHLTDEDVQNAEFVIALIELIRMRAELGAALRAVLVPRGLRYGSLWDTLHATVKVTRVSCSRTRTVFKRRMSLWIPN